MTDTKYEPADIEIYVKNKGLVLKEKSLVAFTQYGIRRHTARYDGSRKKGLRGFSISYGRQNGDNFRWHL